MVAVHSLRLLAGSLNPEGEVPCLEDVAMNLAGHLLEVHRLRAASCLAHYIVVHCN